MGSQRVGHSWATYTLLHREGNVLSTLSVFIHWIIRPTQSNSVQLILIICTFCMYIFASLLKFMCIRPKSVQCLCNPLKDTEWRTTWVTDVRIPSSGDLLPFCFRSYTLSRCPLDTVPVRGLGAILNNKSPVKKKKTQNMPRVALIIPWRRKWKWSHSVVPNTLWPHGL